MGRRAAAWPGWRWQLAALAAAACASSGATAGAAGDDADWRYRIVKGDTLIAIADNYLAPGKGWQGLQQRNRIADPRRLMPGRELQIPVAWLRTEAQTAEVLFARGDASVQGPGDAAAAPARSGLVLRMGTALRTGEQSSIVVRLADGSRLLVAPQTQMTLEQLLLYGRSGLRRSAIRLERGAVETQVVPAPMGPLRPLEIRTPTVTLGVRGTEFRSHADSVSGDTGVEVLEGKVGASADREVLVGAGFGTVARRGGVVAEPRPMLPAPQPVAAAGRALDVRWDAVAGATGYHAQVLAAGDGVLWLDTRTTDTTLRWNGDAAGDYRLRVRAIDDLGLEGRDGELPFAVAAAPPPAGLALLRPAADGRAIGDGVTFTWRPAGTARGYRLQVAETADFAHPLFDGSDAVPAGSGDLDVRVELPPGRYHWRVAPVAADGSVGEFGAARSFELIAPR